MKKRNKSLYGAIIQCECGRTHHIDPQEVIYGEEIFNRLAQCVSRYTEQKHIAVVEDTRTRTAAGEHAAQALSAGGYDVREVIVADPSPGADPVCDQATLEMVLRGCGGAGCIVAAGSGVINDLGKWASCKRNIPYICIPTAASMNGYSSANIAATVNGVKTVVDGWPPKAILAAPSVLCNAPLRMTASGLGDVLAKSVSSADWKMNSIMFGDYYCERSNAVIAGIEPVVMTDPLKIKEREPAAVSRLFDALLLTGVAMTMAESSAPASGGEHLVSHALDMMSAVDGSAHDMHGRQVGIGTILASELYRRVFAVDQPVIVPQSDSISKVFWGRLAAEVEEHFGEKKSRLSKAAAFIQQLDSWNNLRKQVSPFIREPEKIRTCLKKAGAAYRPADIGCAPQRLVKALIHGREIRSRFTVLDLAFLIGILPSQADDIVSILNFD